MVAASEPISRPAPPLRAGFWRRYFALGVDALIVFAPMQLLAGLLFWQTHGVVQWRGAIDYCVEIPALPPGVTSHIRDFDLVEQCHEIFLGVPSGAWLIVTRDRNAGDSTATMSETIPLDGEGRPVKSYNIHDRSGLLLFAYLVAFVATRGTTPGGALLGVRVLRSGDIAQGGIGWRASVTRYLGLTIGVWLYAAAGFLAALINIGGLFHHGGLLASIIATEALAFGWPLLQVALIVERKDTLPDRWAGTMVVGR